MRPYTYAEMYQSETSHFWFRGKQEFVSAEIKRLRVPAPKILDIGCGTGGTTQFLGKWGKIIGVEKNKRAAALAIKRGVDVRIADIHRLPFSSNTFDIVTILDVLYHKGIDETEALREAYRILKPKGIILITDCATPWLWSVHDTDMDAKYRYTKKHLASVITRAGFQAQKIRYIYATIFPLVALARLFKKIRKDSATLDVLPQVMNNFLVLLLTWEASWHTRFSLPFGSSLLAVIQKR